MVHEAFQYLVHLKQHQEQRREKAVSQDPGGAGTQGNEA
jgi:hypothetical protein